MKSGGPGLGKTGGGKFLVGGLDGIPSTRANMLPVKQAVRKNIISRIL